MDRFLATHLQRGDAAAGGTPSPGDAVVDAAGDADADSVAHLKLDAQFNDNNNGETRNTSCARCNGNNRIGKWRGRSGVTERMANVAERPKGQELCAAFDCFVRRFGELERNLSTRDREKGVKTQLGHNTTGSLR